MATLSGFFGFLAALLATIGLYGVMSYMVAQRQNEIGIRMALGANGGDVLRMILREAGLLLGIGLVGGTVLALAADARRLDAVRTEAARSADPADRSRPAGRRGARGEFLPARRAASLDPMAALREE